MREQRLTTSRRAPAGSGPAAEASYTVHPGEEARLDLELEFDWSFDMRGLLFGYRNGERFYTARVSGNAIFIPSWDATVWVAGEQVIHHENPEIESKDALRFEWTHDQDVGLRCRQTGIKRRENLQGRAWAFGNSKLEVDAARTCFALQAPLEIHVRCPGAFKQQTHPAVELAQGCVDAKFVDRQVESPEW